MWNGDETLLKAGREHGGVGLGTEDAVTRWMDLKGTVGGQRVLRSWRSCGSTLEMVFVFLFFLSEGKRVSELSECRPGRGLHLGRKEGIQALRGSQLCEGRV